MGNSLMDQLKRSGLVNEQQVKTARVEKRREVKRRRKGKSPDAAAPDGAARARSLLAEKAERDRELNRERDAEREARAIAAQIRQIIERNRQPRDGGDVAFNFTDGTRVARLPMPPAMRRDIINGRLAIVRMDDAYEVIPAVAADKIGERDSTWVMVRNEREESTQADDSYAEFKVPDDLLW